MNIFKHLSFCYVVHNLYEGKNVFVQKVVQQTTHVQTKVTISRRDIIKCFIYITNKIDISEKQSFTCHKIHHVIVQAVPSCFNQKWHNIKVGTLKMFLYNYLFICLFMPNVYLIFYSTVTKTEFAHSTLSIHYITTSFFYLETAFSLSKKLKYNAMMIQCLP